MNHFPIEVEVLIMSGRRLMAVLSISGRTLAAGVLVSVLMIVKVALTSFDVTQLSPAMGLQEEKMDESNSSSIPRMDFLRNLVKDNGEDVLSRYSNATQSPPRITDVNATVNTNNVRSPRIAFVTFTFLAKPEKFITFIFGALDT